MEYRVRVTVRLPVVTVRASPLRVAARVSSTLTLPPIIDGGTF